MKPYLTLLLLTLIGFSKAQNVTTKFGNDVCSCLKKINLEGSTSSDEINKQVGTCFVTSATTYQKEFKKSKVIDLDKATEEEVIGLWKYVWQQCNETGQAVVARTNQLEDAEADLSFQGIITYAHDLDVGSAFKKMGITREMLLEKMNADGSWFDTLWVYHRLGNYAVIGSDSVQTTKIYDSSDNTVYTFQGNGNDICSVQEAVDLDLSGEADKPTVTVVDSAVTIMGFPCKIIRMKWGLGQYDYYYNDSQARVNPALFAQHTSEGLAEFLKLSGSLPLQVVKSAMGMIVIQTAVNIQQGRIDSAVFDLPQLVEDESLNTIRLPGITMMRVKK